MCNSNKITVKTLNHRAYILVCTYLQVIYVTVLHYWPKHMPRQTKLNQENEGNKVKPKQDWKNGKWNSPRYYEPSSKSCFVNTHNGGEVFFTDRADKFGNRESEAGGWFINSHCTTTS